MYGIPEDLSLHFSSIGERPVKELNDLGGTHHESIDELIEKVGETIDGSYSS